LPNISKDNQIQATLLNFYPGILLFYKIYTVNVKTVSASTCMTE